LGRKPVLFSQLSTNGSHQFQDVKIYPAMFEITGGIPEPIIGETEEAWSPENMSGLHWKSDAAATVVHPLLKGNGRSA
jgi:hypothetical protein